MWVSRGRDANLAGWPRHALCFLGSVTMPSEVKERPRVTKEEDVWVVRLDRGGKRQEYRCATEAQARALEAALSQQ
jgi:hypothetical protein